MAPCEAVEFLDESSKGMVEKAWWVGRLFHSDPKKYPAKPSSLWDTDADRQSPNQMFHLALALASNGAEIRRQLKEQGKL